MDRSAIKQEYLEQVYRFKKYINTEPSIFMQCQQNSSHYENIPMEEQIKEENFTDSIELPCKSMEPSGLMTSFNSIENWTNSEKFSPQAINANIQSNDSDCVSENSIQIMIAY